MSEDAEKLIGQDVKIPVEVWPYARDQPAVGYISNLTAPTRHCPSGRYEVTVPGEKDRAVFKVEDFSPSWILPTRDMSSEVVAAPVSGTSSKTPSRPRTASAAAAKTPSGEVVIKEEPHFETRGTRSRASRRAAQPGPTFDHEQDDHNGQPTTIKTRSGSVYIKKEEDFLTPQPTGARSKSVEGRQRAASGTTPAGTRRSTRRSARAAGGNASAPETNDVKTDHETDADLAQAEGEDGPQQQQQGAGQSAQKSMSRRTPRTAAKGGDAAAAGGTPDGKRVTFNNVPDKLPEVTKAPSSQVLHSSPDRKSFGHNLFNFLLMIAVGVPAAVIGYLVVKADPTSPALSQPLDLTWANFSVASLLDLTWWQRLGLHNPLVFVNLVFLLNVDFGFWLVALLQRTTWLIDPYWTFIPVMMHMFFQYHPFAVTLPIRSIVVTCILRGWSIRLTHSYFRREEWQFGAREDWRFTDLSSKVGYHWWWLSFFATYLSQHAMLVGISLPLYAVYISTEPWNHLDTVACGIMIFGIIVAWHADNQLRDFMVTNMRRREAGLEPILILDTGLWHHSRHPNYFGEQSYWWGLALLAVRLGHPWMIIGQAFNHACMFAVVDMTEKRMLRRPERAAAFKEYCRTTNQWIPWFKKQPTVIEIDDKDE